jgi:hypothetical protein
MLRFVFFLSWMKHLRRSMQRTKNDHKLCSWSNRRSFLWKSTCVRAHMYKQAPIKCKFMCKWHHCLHESRRMGNLKWPCIFRSSLAAGRTASFLQPPLQFRRHSNNAWLNKVLLLLPDWVSIHANPRAFYYSRCVYDPFLCPA